MLLPAVLPLGSPNEKGGVCTAVYPTTWKGTIIVAKILKYTLLLHPFKTGTEHTGFYPSGSQSTEREMPCGSASPMEG